MNRIWGILVWPWPDCLLWPCNCQHYKLTQTGISVNGEEIPFKPLKLNFDDKLFVTAYNTFFSGTGKLHKNSGSIIKREDYSKGYTIILADLAPFEIGDKGKVGYPNYPIASLFYQVGVILGDKLISSATNTYAHRYILEVLLNYDKESAESQLGCGIFCKDTAGQMEEMDISADPVLKQGMSGQKRANCQATGYDSLILI